MLALWKGVGSNDVFIFENANYPYRKVKTGLWVCVIKWWRVKLLDEAEYNLKNCYVAPLYQNSATSLPVLIGVRAGGGGRGGLQQILGNSVLGGQQEKIWAKPAFKDVSMFI